MSNIVEIKNKLAQVISESEYSQTEIANKLGVKPTQVCSYVKGRKCPSLETLSKLCVILNVSADYILGVNLT